MTSADSIAMQEPIGEEVFW